MFILICALVTALLVYYSTFELDALETVLLLACFAAVIYALWLTPRRHEAFSQLDDGWIGLDTGAFAKLVQVPDKVRDMLEPPLKEMVQGPAHDPEPDDLEDVQPDRYVEAEDAYVGKSKPVTERDTFGRESTLSKFVVDEELFHGMKLEYKKVDSLLSKLRDASLTLYETIIPKKQVAKVTEETETPASTGAEAPASTGTHVEAPLP